MTPATLGLPPIPAGQEPPATCPICGAAVHTDSGVKGVDYVCGASYWHTVDWVRSTTGPLRPLRTCPEPPAVALLRAALERMTEEERARYAFSGWSDGDRHSCEYDHEVRECIDAVIAALEAK